MKIEGIFGAVIGFVAGAAAGGTVAYLISEQKNMKKYLAEINKITAKQKEEQPAEEPTEPEKKENDAEAEEKKKADEIAAMYREVTLKAVAEYEEEKKSSGVYSKPNTETIDYTSYSSPKKDKSSDPVTERRKMRSADRPYIISEEEFDNTFPEFMKRENILYYTESHELVDDEDETILDIDQTIGQENLLIFLEDVKRFPGKGSVAIRNESIATDYLVTIVDGSYSYMV